jgi:hypothetical protein
MTLHWGPRGEEVRASDTDSYYLEADTPEGGRDVETQAGDGDREEEDDGEEKGAEINVG